MENVHKPAATAASSEPSTGFSKEERAAIKERAAELRAEKRRSRATNKEAEDTSAVLAAIAQMPDADRVLAERLHAVIMATVPGLSPKLWYGMPAYARDGNIVCFFQGAQKFKTRYATLGFNDEANLDDGTIWPTAFALTGLSEADEVTIAALLTRAVS
ncbi:iron chaperone [Cryobacterium gelidum]|uniref:DUF1801 domain-containing protein n=1 Tax=Cryobacterium gelidum TaxID=1259164 RepID=A0A4R9B0R9_9MICO|nr:DUF1801 domain-containing protein [Cryobacterium gelidum]TFD73594.1 DUF1801 domain-containing protein [Cryobacterium gelidum]